MSSSLVRVSECLINKNKLKIIMWINLFGGVTDNDQLFLRPGECIIKGKDSYFIIIHKQTCPLSWFHGNELNKEKGTWLLSFCVVVVVAVQQCLKQGQLTFVFIMFWTLMLCTYIIICINLYRRLWICCTTNNNNKRNMTKKKRQQQQRRKERQVSKFAWHYQDLMSFLCCRDLSPHTDTERCGCVKLNFVWNEKGWLLHTYKSIIFGSPFASPCLFCMEG